MTPGDSRERGPGTVSLGHFRRFAKEGVGPSGQLGRQLEEGVGADVGGWGSLGWDGWVEFCRKVEGGKRGEASGR